MASCLNKDLPKPLLHKIKTINRNKLFTSNTVLPRHIHVIPPWEELNVTIDFYMSEETNGKENTPAIVYKNLFMEVLNKYGVYSHIYTNGSMLEGNTGCAVVWEESVLMYKLPKSDSIFSSKTFAIDKTISEVNWKHIVKSMIFLYSNPP